MSQQIQITGGAKVRDLQDVIIGSSGVLSSLGFNVANGVPQLDSNGKILVSQLPNSVMEYKGTWNAATNTPTLADGTGNQGDVYLCNVAGTANFGSGPITFVVGDSVIYSGSIWQRAGGATGSVTSVGLSTNGGAITISNSPITTSGTIAFNFNGTSGQYVNGAGNLTTFPSLTGYVPYTGATGNVDLGEYELKAGQLTLDVSPTGTPTVGTTVWNNTIGSSETLLKGGTVLLKNGVDLVARVVNKVTPNTTLTKATYPAVRVSGAQGQRLAVAFAQANNDNNSADTIGLVIETIATNQEGFIMTVGQLLDINTTGSLQGETWADGDVLYLSPTTAGALTNIKPTGLTGHIVVMGYVEYAHAVHGSIYVKVMNGWELDELHNVYISSPTNNQGLFYNSSNQLWENKSIATALGYTPANDALVVHLSGTETITGSKTFSGLQSFTNTAGTDLTYGAYLTKNSIPSAFSSTTVNLYSASGNNNLVIRDNGNTSKLQFQATSSYTYTFPASTGTLALTSDISYPVTSVFGRTGAVVATEGDYNLTQLGDVTITTPSSGQVLRYNGTSWENSTESYVGTVTSVGLSAPTGFSVSGSPVTSSGTLALAFAAGYSLPTNASQTNWDTAYTNRITSATAPLSITSNVISISQATTSTSGYLSSTDWNTFNNKQATITLTTTGSSGAATLVGATLNIPNYGSALSGYLPLTGGTLTGALNINVSSGTALNVAGNAIFRGDTGVATPRQLVIQSGGSTPVYLEAKGYGANYITDFGIRTYNNVGTAFEVFYADSSGRVGINQVSPSYQLDVNGTFRVTSDATLGGSSTIFGTTGSKFYVYPAFSTNLNLLQNYNGSAYTTEEHRASDYSFKIGTTTGLILNASGNLGLGVIPSAWNTVTAFQVGSTSLGGYSNTGYLSTNAFYQSGWKYINTSYAARYEINSGDAGVHAWYTAPSGTAGNPITFTQSMTLDASGRLGIGTTSPNSTLEVYGTSQASPNTSNAIFKVNGSATNAIVMGTLSGSPFATYIQSGGSGTYPLSLNPNGGNVLIGTTTDRGFKLVVEGTDNNNLMGSYNTTSGASLRMQSNQTVNYIVSATNQLQFEVGAAIRMAITTGGNVGIGTSSPSAASGLGLNKFIDIAGASVPGIVFHSSNGTQECALGTGAQGLSIGAYGAASASDNIINFFTSNTNSSNSITERMRITSGGTVCIGTTSAYGSNLLNVNGGIYATSSIAAVVAADIDMFVFSNTGASYSKSCVVASINALGGTGSYFFYGQQNAGTVALKIFSNGNIQNTNNSYGAISDARLKENITDATPKLDDLMKVKVRNYNLKGESSKQLGVISQELEQIFPNMIEESTNMGENMKIKGVKYSVFVPMLIKAVQELKAEIEILKNK